MIEETAIVQSAQHGFINVITTQTSGCHQCSESQTCSTSILSKFFGDRDIELKLQSDLVLEKGDLVTIGINESTFMRLTCLIYLIPLLGLFLFAVLGQYLTSLLAINNELLTITFGLVGFAACYYLIKQLIQRFLDPQRINPIILKKL